MDGIELGLKIIEIVLSIAGFMILFYTLKEMIKERRSSYRPDVVTETKQITVIFGSELDDTELDDNIREIKLYNIGLGVAKKISLSWNYDINQFVTIIKELDTKNEFDIKIIDEKDDSIKWLKINKTHFNLSTPNKKAYILPQISSEDYWRILLPSHYLTLYSIYWYLVFNQNNKSIIKSSPPTLTARMFYKDSGNDIIKKNLPIRTTFQHSTTEGNKVIIYIEVYS